MNKCMHTPFSEYREEQVKVNIFDYFVEPSFFDKFCDTKPIIISGARGTGKTTILKALSISESNDPERYIRDKEYIGVYYRIDLNVTTSFEGGVLEKKERERLFSYYLICKLSYELVSQVVRFRNKLGIQNEEKICRKFGNLFVNRSDIYSFEDLRDLVYSELHKIRNYINNCAYEEFPHIGDYAVIIKELPQELIENSSLCKEREKTVFYLIDEFEGLSDWQQKLVLSYVKYSNRYHTYKICMRPDGLKTAQTVGGEYIRETDDIRTVDLNDLIIENSDDYYKYALYVCRKRIELFYDKNGYNNEQIKLEDMLEDFTDEQEFGELFKKKTCEIHADIDNFIKKLSISDCEIERYFKENYLDFYICKLLYQKNRQRKEFSKIFNSVRNKDAIYTDALGNYKYALLYYFCIRYKIQKDYSGFGTLVNISGGTLRYLLELCNEVFERAILVDGFDYNEPKVITHKTQTNAVMSVSSKRVGQISAIPQIGLNMRTFVISLGKIYRIFHQDSSIAKFEPNHFSIKASNANLDGNIKLFLRECVMRGVLLKQMNNKNKLVHSISPDEYIYRLHPIYTPSFQISWRRKQKNEFDENELRILIGNNTKEINSLIKKYQNKYIEDEAVSDWDYYQMELVLEEEE